MDWMGGWKSPGGVKYRTAYAAYNKTNHLQERDSRAGEG